MLSQQSSFKRTASIHQESTRGCEKSYSPASRCNQILHSYFKDLYWVFRWSAWQCSISDFLISLILLCKLQRGYFTLCIYDALNGEYTSALFAWQQCLIIILHPDKDTLSVWRPYQSSKYIRDALFRQNNLEDDSSYCTNHSAQTTQARGTRAEYHRRGNVFKANRTCLGRIVTGFNQI